MNKTVIILIIIILLGVGGYFYFHNNSENTVPESQTESITGEEADMSNDMIESTTTPATGTTAKTYTLAEVGAHKTEADCWSAINGGVYNLTAWIGSHPGGPQAIAGLCGKDGSAAFNGQHGGQKQQADVLATFKIGTLK